VIILRFRSLDRGQRVHVEIEAEQHQPFSIGDLHSPVGASTDRSSSGTMAWTNAGRAEWLLLVAG
jgi:hypothetical protein